MCYGHGHGQRSTWHERRGIGLQMRSHVVVIVVVVGVVVVVVVVGVVVVSAGRVSFW